MSVGLAGVHRDHTTPLLHDTIQSDADIMSHTSGLKCVDSDSLPSRTGLHGVLNFKSKQKMLSPTNNMEAP